MWATFMVGARRLPTLHWGGVYGGCALLTHPTLEGVYGGCALLTHPTLARRLWWARVAYLPYIGEKFMVGARRLSTLHWEGVGGRASLTHPTLGRHLWWVRVAYPPYIEATFMVGARRLPTLHWKAFMVGARCLPTLHREGVGGCALLTHPTPGRRWWVRVAYPPYGIQLGFW